MEGGLFRPNLGLSYRATCDRPARWLHAAGMTTHMDAALRAMIAFIGLFERHFG